MKRKYIEEIKKMVGTEFIYIHEDGSEIPAVIAAFDPKVGFTSLATSLVDSFGDDHSGDVDDNGNLCLLGYSAVNFCNAEMVQGILFILKSIRCLAIAGWIRILALVTIKVGAVALLSAHFK